MEQKLVVKTPSFATNVSEYSSVGQRGILKTCKVFHVDLPRLIELLIRLSCAVIPAMRIISSPGLISSDLLLPVLFCPDSSILYVFCNCRIVILT